MPLGNRAFTHHLVKKKQWEISLLQVRCDLSYDARSLTNAVLSFEQACLPRLPASQWLPACLPPAMHAGARSASSGIASGRARTGLMPMARAAIAVRRLWSCIVAAGRSCGSAGEIESVY